MAVQTNTVGSNSRAQRSGRWHDHQLFLSRLNGSNFPIQDFLAQDPTGENPFGNPTPLYVALTALNEQFIETPLPVIEWWAAKPLDL